MSALDYDRITLDSRDLSYEGQLRDLTAEGWELDEAARGAQATSTRYLRRHRRVAEIHGLFAELGKSLRLRLEDDGTWSATVAPDVVREEGQPDPQGGTALEAAEAAWERFGNA